ncbi:MAG: phosphoribosylamine--glycine ligase [Gemmatimonadota bacterium]|nr:phosphoribosylamine--glycine ligase [Gemmatimonadota bacterium]
MKILVVGSGGREHAFIDKFRTDDPDAEIFAAPGNPGMAEAATCVDVASGNVEGLATLARSHGIDLTVVGPEAPLADGIADRFEADGLPVFGPSAAAARLESSKAFAKDLMRANGVPTAAFRNFTDVGAARAYIDAHPEPLVVKASGLAAGKGAIVCETRAEALAALEAVMVESRFGTAGAEVVVEEFMEGVELSVFFLADGARAVPLLTSRDYKRIDEGDVGLNTGGMGAYSPAAPCAPDFLDEVRATVADPVLRAMAAAGTPYRGFLYVGLMLTSEGPKVVEFNCRLGDPETQAVLPLTASDLIDPLGAVARGESLAGWRPEARPGAALVTVVASAGYPESSDSGRPIRLPDVSPDVARIYHAGTALSDGELVTAGGRVFGVTGLGSTLAEAAETSRRVASEISFEGAQWRSDIGWHELEPGRVEEPWGALLTSA